MTMICCAPNRDIFNQLRIRSTALFKLKKIIRPPPRRLIKSNSVFFICLSIAILIFIYLNYPGQQTFIYIYIKMQMGMIFIKCLFLKIFQTDGINQIEICHKKMSFEGKKMCEDPGYTCISWGVGGGEGAVLSSVLKRLKQ